MASLKKKRSILLISIGSFILLIIVTVVLWTLFGTKLFGSREQILYEEAVVNLDRSFKNILSVAKTGDQDALRAAYEREVGEAKNPLERGTLMLSLAQFTILTSVPDGVLVHKAIAEDSTLPNEVRAAALLNLGYLYHASTVDQDALTEAIFSGSERFIGMRPQGPTSLDRERAYASLFLYAESFHPTALANSYIARYWAKDGFLNTASGTALESRNNAQMHIERLEWVLEGMPAIPENLNIPMSTIVRGITEVYLAAGNGSSGAEEGLARIDEGLEGLSTGFEIMLQSSIEDAGTRELLESDLERTMHGIWRDLLTTAVDVRNVEPVIAETIANKYARYIQSPAGLHERVYAISGDSDVTALLSELKLLSTELREAL